MVQRQVKSAIKSFVHSFGYDIIPFPLDDGFERQLTLGKHLGEVFARCGINCVFDVGAHYGEYGAFLRHSGYTGKILSFEPITSNFEQLQARAAEDPLWETYHMALGAEDTTMDINVCHDTQLSSFLLPNDYCASHMGTVDGVNYNNPMELVAGKEQVQVKTVNGIFNEYVAGIADPRVFLKMDTQGYDLQILRHATDHLDRIHGLQSELSLIPAYDAMPSYLEALPAMREMGYEVTGFFPVNRDANCRLIEIDCVMIRDIVKMSRTI
jgi:FkbM family methyltransferase